MPSFSTLSLFCLHFAFANAALFILEPFGGTTCQGGQPCNVTWEENGDQPLLSAIKVTTVALYSLKQQLVQTLPPVNVATTSHFTFTPLPAAGPDSEDYYIAFTSTEVNGTDGPYIGYSSFFQLTGMTGSFNSPLPAATSSIPIPQSIQTPSILSGTSTATVGTLSPSLSPPTSGLPPTSTSFTSSSGFSTSRPAVSILSTSSSASATASSKSNGSSSHLSAPLPVLLLALFSSVFFS